MLLGGCERETVAGEANRTELRRLSHASLLKLCRPSQSNRRSVRLHSLLWWRILFSSGGRTESWRLCACGFA
jgi:hypothetical protein